MERQSNIELLRIICMFMIVMLHFALNVWFPDMIHLIPQDTIGGNVILLSHCLFFIGVNCFILISGYFSIKTSLRGFLHLYGFYAFYALLIAVSQYFIWGQYDEMPIIAKLFHIAVHSLMPWDNNNFWFLNAYLALFMMAPLLNAAIGSLTKSAYIRILVLLTILNVIFGNLFSINLLNTWGFCVAQFVYLYMIAGYIRNYFSLESIKKCRWRSFRIYIISSMLWGVLVFVQVYQYPFLARFFKAFSYNNIFVLAAAIGFFLFMLSFDIKSRAINWLSFSCLAAYFLQGSVLPFGWYLDVLEKYPFLHNPFHLLTISALFLLLSLLFDKIRVGIAKPFDYITKKYVPNIEERINQIYDKIGK